MPGRLDGKVALVTGGGSGIGRASALTFLREGARVVIGDVNEASLAETMTLARAQGAAERLAPLRVDVSAERDVAALVALAVERFGGLDCVFNNAGVGGAFGPIGETTVEEWDFTFAVLVRGVFLGIKHGAARMKAQGRGGSIINTASIAGLMGSPMIAVYSASKHAVIGLTKSAAWECTGTGVRVNCVCPGLIDSRMLSTILQGRNPGNEPPPNEKIVDRIPARRLGQASEVASIVAFLASDEASYVSGSAYTVDGGRTAA